MPTIRTKSGGTRAKATGKSGTHTMSGASRKKGYKVSTSSSGKVATGMTAIKEEIAANKKKLPEEMTHGAGTILQYNPYKSGSVSSQIALKQRTREAGKGNVLAQREIAKYKETGDISVITGAKSKKVFSKLELEARARARAKAPKLEAYKYSLDKQGNIIEAMESKTGKFGAVGIGRKDQAGNWVSYLSSKQVQAQNRTIKYATTGIHDNTNALDKKRILESRKAYLNQIPQSGKADSKAYFIQQDLNAALAKQLGYKNPLSNEQSGKVIAYMDKIKKYSPEKQAQLMATKFNKPNITEDALTSVSNVVNKANAILAKGMLPNIIKPYVDRADAKLSESKRYSELKEKTVSSVEGSKYLAPAAKVGKEAYVGITTKPINTAATMGELYVLGGASGLVVGAGKVALKTGIKKAAIATGSKAVIEASPKVAMAASTGLDIGIAIPLVSQFASKDIEGKYKLLGELAIGGAGYSKGASIIGRRYPGIETGLVKRVTPSRFEIATKKALSREGLLKFIKDERADLTISPVHSVKGVTKDGKLDLKLEYYEYRNSDGEIIGKGIEDTFISSKKLNIPEGKESVKITEYNISNGKPVKTSQSTYKFTRGQNGININPRKSGTKVKKLTQSQKNAIRATEKKKLESDIEKLTPVQLRKAAKDNNLDVIVEKVIEVKEVRKTGDPLKDFEMVEKHIAKDSSGNVLSSDIEKYPLDLKKFAGESIKTAEIKSGKSGQVLVQKQKILQVPKVETKVKLKVTQKSIQRIVPKSKYKEFKLAEKKTEPFRKSTGKKMTRGQQIAKERAERKAEIKEKAKTETKTKQELKIKVDQIQNAKLKSKMSDYIKLVPLGTIAQRTKSLETVDQAVRNKTLPAIVPKILSKIKQDESALVVSKGKTVTKAIPTIKQTTTTKKTRPRKPTTKSTSKSTRRPTEIKPLIPIPEYKLKKISDDVSEIASFERAFRVRTNVLGTLSSVLGGGTTKTPKNKRKTPLKTTRKPRRKVSTS